MKKNNLKTYLSKILQNYPNISSGRINYDFYEKRIEKNIKIIKDFIKAKKNDK